MLVGERGGNGKERDMKRDSDRDRDMDRMRKRGGGGRVDDLCKMDHR